MQLALPHFAAILRILKLRFPFTRERVERSDGFSTDAQQFTVLLHDVFESFGGAEFPARVRRRRSSLRCQSRGFLQRRISSVNGRRGIFKR